VRSLTTAQVNETVKRWIKPENLTIIEAGDFERKKP
jgi:predicted Zn-dependent peptidase